MDNITLPFAETLHMCVLNLCRNAQEQEKLSHSAKLLRSMGPCFDRSKVPGPDAIQQALKTLKDRKLALLFHCGSRTNFNGFFPFLPAVVDDDEEKKAKKERPVTSASMAQLLFKFLLNLNKNGLTNGICGSRFFTLSLSLVSARGNSAEKAIKSVGHR